MLIVSVGRTLLGRKAPLGADNSAWKQYVDTEHRYSVKVPNDWIIIPYNSGVSVKLVSPGGTQAMQHTNRINKDLKQIEPFPAVTIAYHESISRLANSQSTTKNSHTLSEYVANDTRALSRRNITVAGQPAYAVQEIGSSSVKSIYISQGAGILAIYIEQPQTVVDQKVLSSLALLRN